MKPNFALDLSHDGISLLFRDNGGWARIGEVDLDDPDMSAALAELRRIAEELADGPIASKLVVPNSQILYTTVEAPGPDDTAREIQIRAALEGLTPYAVADLVFDWRADGQTARVAVLAKETMDEAEGFAAQFGFNPISFVARPEGGTFSGEPFFGKTNGAARILPAGERVLPDAAPVPRSPRQMDLSALSSFSGPASTAPKRATLDPFPTPSSETAKNVVQVQPEPAPTAIADAPTSPKVEGFEEKDRAQPSDEKISDQPIASEPTFTRDITSGSLPETPSEGHEEVTSEPPVEKTTSQEAASDKVETPLSARAPKPYGAAPSLQPTSRRPVAASGKMPVLDPFPPTPRDPSDLGPTRYKPITNPAQERVPSAPPLRPATLDKATSQPVEAEVPAPAFSTRRGATPDVSAPSIAPLKKPADKIEAETSKPVVAPTPTPPAKVIIDDIPRGLAGEAERRRQEMARALSQKGASSETPKGLGMASRMGGALAGLSKSKKAETPVANLIADHGPVPIPLAPATEPKATPAKKPSRFSRKEKRTDEAASARSREAEALTVFGERKRTAPQRGGSKYMGLILTLVLILLMAVAAIWSTFFLDDEVTLFNPDTPEQTASLDPAVTPEAERTPEPAIVDESAAVLTPEAAEARYAATGVWQRAPDPLGEPETERSEDVYIASIDPSIGAADAVALPDPGLATSEPPVTPAPPPPPGTTFDLNDQGLVIPTPEGAVSPTGALVIAGTPPVVPPVRPVDLAPPATETQDDASLALDPQEPGLRPRTRPENLAELTERSQLGGQSLAELAEIRPRGRPDDLNTSLPEDTQIAEATTAEIDALVTQVVALTNPTELAIDRSPRPSNRPANFTQIVARVQERAAATPEPEPQQTAARSRESSPEDDGEPDVVVASAAPSRIPSAASVAQQATMKNALNLRNINLIGIYGSKSTRRALVRMSNGRYVKVGVGDNLDGGRVTAISASRLTYQKGNRQLSLDVLPLG